MPTSWAGLSGPLWIVFKKILPFQVTSSQTHSNSVSACLFFSKLIVRFDYHEGFKLTGWGFESGYCFFNNGVHTESLHTHLHIQPARKGGRSLSLPHRMASNIPYRDKWMGNAIAEPQVFQIRQPSLRKVEGVGIIGTHMQGHQISRLKSYECVLYVAAECWWKEIHHHTAHTLSPPSASPTRT